MHFQKLARSVLGVFAVIAALTGASAHAQTFLGDAQRMFFDKTMLDRRFGIEIEFKGVDDAMIRQIIVDKLGATIRETKDNGEAVFDTPYGKVELKIEGQAWRYEDGEHADPKKYAEQVAIDRVQAPREIVFPPMTYRDVEAIQSVSLALKEAGAIGTTAKNAVSQQVNVEMLDLVAADGAENPKAVEDLVNLIRVYSNPEHYKQINDEIKVPKIRREYIGDPSPGFLKRIADPNYRPTARELFDDYFYRQGLELLVGDKPEAAPGVTAETAWTMPLEQVKTIIAAQPDPYVSPRVTKMQRLRVSSLLLKAFATDPLAARVIATRWAKPVPIVEFREMNTDFDIRTTIEQCLGIVRSVEVFGDYDHDQLVSQLTGVDPRDLVQLRDNALKLRNRKWIVRYALQDPKGDYFAHQNDDAGPGDAKWIQLDPDHVGSRPLVLGGDSIVYNRRGIHRDTLLGKYNPGLENALIQQAMENKLFEARLFGRYAQGAMPRAATLHDLAAGKKLGPTELVHLLNVEFPNGWVMKGAWDLSTERMFISDQLDLADLIRQYRNGFESYRAKIEKQYKGEDPEYIISMLKKHAGYRGWKIVQMLSQPDLVFFQERLRIVREFRVEVQGGKVLGHGSTIDRYAYLKSTKNRKVSPGEVAGAEAFTQSVLDRLPDAMRFLPYGFDVALIENGEYKMIESNPGGNSSFLEENQASVEALDAYLKRYPKLIESGEIKLMSPEEQIGWIRRELGEAGFETATNYPGYEFTADDIRDTQYPAVTPPKSVCERLLTERDVTAEITSARAGH